MERDALTWTPRPICARRAATATALCGSAAYSTLFTNESRYVSCPGCVAEIARRLADPTRRGPVAPAVTARVA